MPLTPRTLTRLDPALPPLWRDGDTLQFGISGDLRITVGAPWVEPLLARLSAGFRRTSFDLVAHAVGAPRDEARALLSRLDGLLVDEPERRRAAWVESIDLPGGRYEHRMREALADEGVPAGRRDDPRACGIVLVRGAAAALQLAPYLRTDTAHLAVAVERGRMTIGPLVIPGESPCLSCRDGQERDRDPAWPLLHTQLIGRDPGPVSLARIAQAGALAARLLGEGEPAGAYVVVTDDERRWRSVAFHEECRCRDRWSRSLRGTATARARPDRPSETTRATAFARPA